MATVTLHNVWKRYTNDAPPAVRDFSLEIPHNEFLVFVGHSVAGVVGVKLEFYRVIDIAPVRMMVHFFCMEGHFRHKAECFGEIFEFEGRLQRVVFFCPHNFSYLDIRR